MSVTSIKAVKHPKMATKSELADYGGPDRVVSSYEIEEEVKSARKREWFKINSGIPALDYHTKGFREGELVVVSGPTGEGKTLLCQTITEHACNKQDTSPLWFSFEMPPAQFLRCFPNVPYFFMPKELKPYSWEWFQERCFENEIKFDGRVVIIDHLHFLLHFFQTGSPSLEIGRLVRQTKSLAVDNGYIVFLIAHIHKIADGAKASMRNIRDSSFVSQEADTVLMIQRDARKDHKKEAIITVDKCRHTGVFAEEVKVKKIDGYLRELTVGPIKYPSDDELPF